MMLVSALHVDLKNIAFNIIVGFNLGRRVVTQEFWPDDSSQSRMLIVFVPVEGFASLEIELAVLPSI